VIDQRRRHLHVLVEHDFPSASVMKMCRKVPSGMPANTN
jgi:hypothetical protein